jgi:CheY-like chemotaxis protein
MVAAPLCSIRAWPARSDDKMAAYLDQAGYVVERATTGV